MMTKCVHSTGKLPLGDGAVGLPNHPNITLFDVVVEAVVCRLDNVKALNQSK